MEAEKPFTKGTKNTSYIGEEGILRIIDSIVSRQDDLRQAENRWIADQFESIRSSEKAESDRLNELRKVDVEAVGITNERAAKQAEVLAKQVADNAEVLRSSVEKTAETIALQLQQITNSLMSRIAALEKADYETKGRTKMSTPLLMMIAGLGGGLIIFLIETWLK